MKNTQVLQGLNLLSTSSIVIIKIEKKEEVEKLLKQISSYHQLFLDSYHFDQDKLSIETPIPLIWEEASPHIQKLSKGDITYKECKAKVVDDLINQRLASMSTIPVLYSAHRQQKEITPTIISNYNSSNKTDNHSKGFNRYYTLGCGKGSQVIYSISSSKDSKTAKQIQRDKWSTNMMMENLGLPIPKWELLNEKTDIDKIWDSYTKPVVVKPTGLAGGNGVVLGIQTKEQCKKAFDFAQKAVNTYPRSEWQKKIMIQEQVQGEDYRLLVIDGKFEVGTKRIPAFVTGDGKKSIKELIEEENKDPKRDLSNPSHTLKPIMIDDSLLDYLKEQKLSLKDIPEKGQKIQLRKVASMSQGGITEDVTDSVGAEIKYIAESIAESIHAFTLGVDVLCKDITKPLTKENGAILEVNTMPEVYLNIFPVIGRERTEVIDTYVSKLLSEGNAKRIVVIGNPSTDIPTMLKRKSLFWSYLKQDDTVGEYRDKELRINGLTINRELKKEVALKALKINASLDAIVFHHRDWDEVEETGLGFSKIDLLIVTKDMKKDKRFNQMLKYRLKGFISKIKVIRTN